MPNRALPPGAREITCAGVLAKHADPGPTALISFTDEEILALVQDPEAEGIELPWIEAESAAENGFDREQARRSALRSLIVRGVVGPENVIAQLEQREPRPEESPLTANSLATGIITRRRAAAGTVRAADAREERNGSLLLFIDRDGTVLHEQVSADGLHHFVMENLEVAAEALQSFALRELTGSVESTEDAAAGTVAWAGPRTELLGTGLPEALPEMTACTRITSVGAAEGELWVASDGTRVVLAQPADDGDQVEIVVVDREVLAEAIRELLALPATDLD